MKQGAVRTQKVEHMEERLTAALRQGVVDRGLPFHVGRVIYRDDGSAWARLEVDVEYQGTPIRPEDIAAGMLDRLVEVLCEQEYSRPADAGSEVARDIARERRAKAPR